VPATSPYFLNAPQWGNQSSRYTPTITVVPKTSGRMKRAKMTTKARSFDRIPACISFCCAFSTCSPWSIFSDERTLFTRSAASFLLVMLRRRLELVAMMPAFSCSRRSFSALTRLAIGSLTVVAA
jgi:hypothetical protein